MNVLGSSRICGRRMWYACICAMSFEGGCVWVCVSCACIYVCACLYGVCDVCTSVCGIVRVVQCVCVCVVQCVCVWTVVCVVYILVFVRVSMSVGLWESV